MTKPVHPAPVGDWPLKGSLINACGDRWHGQAMGNLCFSPDGAVFDGRSARFEIRQVDDLFARGDFTLSADIRIDSAEAESIGDLATKFDPLTRTGFNWSIMDHGGVTSASSNYRNLSFCFDAGSAPQWSDCGRPGNALHICALTVHLGRLYAATFEHGDGEIGRVFRYAGNQRWEDSGVPCKANSVFSLASIDDVLYAASGRYDPRNSALNDTGNMNEETRIWRMDDSEKWQDCGSPRPEGDDLYMLGIYRGRMYAAPSFSRGLYRYEHGQRWTVCAESYPRLLALCQWRGHLYGGSNKALRTLGPPPQREIRFTMLPDADGVYRYDDTTDAWTGCGPIPTETQMYAFCVHRGSIFTGTWPSARVFRSTSGIGWRDCGNLHPDEKEVMAMCVYNGMMYAGTLPGADIYRYDGGERWTQVGNVDSTPNVKYRRAWSMAVHDGTLFVGALPSGRVHAMRTGVAATDSAQMPNDGAWHRVTAVREGATARIYLDGQIRAESAAAKSSNFDLINSLPLQIGFGSHDFFRGKMANLRLYDCALSSRQIGQMDRQR